MNLNQLWTVLDVMYIVEEMHYTSSTDDFLYEFWKDRGYRANRKLPEALSISYYLLPYVRQQVACVRAIVIV